jgi:pathogen-inducible salicylic acid glucosyltransferase
MLQFGKRLALHGLQPTLAVTRIILATCTPGAAALGGAVRVAAVSDCFDRGFGGCGDAFQPWAQGVTRPPRSSRSRAP